MGYAQVAAAAISLIGSLIAAGQEDQAQKIRQGIADKFGAEVLPHFDKMVAQELPPNAADRYMAGSQAKSSQADALRQLGAVIDAKGETVDDKAAYLRSEQATAGQEAGSQSALLRQLGARGLGGSGIEAAMMNQGGQQAIDRGAAANLDEASQARSRMLSAVGQMGSLASTARGQDTDALKAQDAISMFNARARQDAVAGNNAQAQQGFENAMGRDSAQANALNGVAAGYDRAAAGTRQTAGGIGQSIATAGATYDQYGNAIVPPKKKPDWGTA